MNETNLEDTVLSDDADNAVVAPVVAAQPETPAAEQDDLTAKPVVADEPKDVAPVTAPAAVKRAGAGRKVDVSGTTALGYARILYNENPGLDTKQLKALFAEKLVPKFGSTPNVIQTYVSMVRKPKAKKSA